MKQINLTDGEYASKWRLTDFYPGAEEKLRAALASGEDFDTGWFGCKKEIRYARYTLEAGKLTVQVSSHMDDLWDSNDLIYDALWEFCKPEKELPPEIILSIRNTAIDLGIDDHTDMSATISGYIAFDPLVSVTDKLEHLTESHNRHMYQLLCQIVKDHVDYMENKQ